VIPLGKRRKLREKPEVVCCEHNDKSLSEESLGIDKYLEYLNPKYGDEDSEATSDSAEQTKETLFTERDMECLSEESLGIDNYLEYLNPKDGDEDSEATMVSAEQTKETERETRSSLLTEQDDKSLSEESLGIDKYLEYLNPKGGDEGSEATIICAEQTKETQRETRSSLLTEQDDKSLSEESLGIDKYLEYLNPKEGDEDSGATSDSAEQTKETDRETKNSLLTERNMKCLSEDSLEIDKYWQNFSESPSASDVGIREDSNKSKNIVCVQNSDLVLGTDNTRNQAKVGIETTEFTYDCDINKVFSPTLFYSPSCQGTRITEATSDETVTGAEDQDVASALSFSSEVTYQEREEQISSSNYILFDKLYFV
jgi:hypothetical protein